MAAAALLMLLTIAGAQSASAQEMPRVQIFGGYSYTRFDTPSFGFANTTGMSGYTFSPAFNFFRGFGVVGELSGQYTKKCGLRISPSDLSFFIRAAMRCFLDISCSATPAPLYKSEVLKKTPPELST